MSGPWDASSCAARLDELGAWLRAHEDEWRPAPFRVLQPPWVARRPELDAWVRGLSADERAALRADPRAIEAPDEWRERVDAIGELVDVGALEAPDVLPPGHWLARRVKGRKWDQVRGFLGVVEPRVTGGTGPVVEWCSGRGHLGRTLSRRAGRPGLLLERDPQLCAPPTGWREVEGVVHHCVDVLHPEVHEVVPDHAALVGLHACGRLTDRLLEVAVERRAASVAAAPCCPHRRFDAPGFEVLSTVARAHGLELHEDDLRLAVLDDVLASRRDRRERQAEVRLRVAVDLLGREATGQDRLHSFRSVPRATLRLTLGEALHWAMRTHDLPGEVPADLDALEARVAARVDAIEAWGLVRGLHRRVVEMWWVLDRAVWLHEQGWEVAVGTFCEVTASPRNLLIVGHPVSQVGLSTGGVA